MRNHAASFVVLLATTVLLQSLTSTTTTTTTTTAVAAWVGSPVMAGQRRRQLQLERGQRRRQLVGTKTPPSCSSSFHDGGSSLHTLFLSDHTSDHEDTTVVSSSSFSFDTLSTAARAVTALKGQTIVVKYGGNAMTSPALKQAFCQDVAVLQQLGVRVVVVHGGGPQINQLLQQLQVESTFHPTSGMRISTPQVVQAAEMVLSGSVNKEIVATIGWYGGRALGLSGRDGNLLQCTAQDEANLGMVGQVEQVNVALLNQLLDGGWCPVIAPIGTGLVNDDHDNTVKKRHDELKTYNVNADVAAGRIAGELKAARVLFLTDIAGVLNKDKQLIPQLSMEQVQALIEDETITGGMIPKISFATSAVKLGVRAALITDGRVPHALIQEVLGGGDTSLGSGRGGTVITASPPASSSSSSMPLE
ncbi:hypothetical protein ACA910_006512 [Epithemia clementina (nom. ined.)]